MTHAQYSVVYEYMLDCMSASSHDALHVRRVLGFARELCAAEPEADRDVVVLAALLHDIGRPAEYRDPAVDHAVRGSELAEAFLRGQGWPRETVARVAACVLTHRAHADRPPRTLEARLLFDADKLDLTGAVGVARVLQYGAEIGEPLYCLGAEGLPLPGVEGEPASLLREVRASLRDTPRRFFTARAHAIAAKRQAVMDGFFRAFEREIHEAHAWEREAAADIAAPVE